MSTPNIPDLGDTGGVRHIPNPKHVTPEWDTKIKSAPAKLGVGKFRMTGAQGDVKHPEASSSKDVVTPEQMREPHIRSFKTGTDYVPETGLALVHKGEKIIPAKDNPMSFSPADAMARIAPKKPKKEIKEMVHTKSHNGKHIVTHRHHHPEHHPDETHVMNNMSDVASHMEAHAGTPNEGEQAPAPDAAGAPAPLTASPSPMPGQ
jgi:hypothetical protein